MTIRPFPGASLPEMTVREAASHLADPNQTAVLIDVRETYEYVPRHPQGAVNIPMSELVARIDEVPRDQNVLIICEHGYRSVDVVRYLMQQGYTRAFNVDGGADMWEAAHLPMEYLAKP